MHRQDDGVLVALAFGIVTVMWLATPHFSWRRRKLTIVAGTVRLWSWRRSSAASAGQQPLDVSAHAPRGLDAGAAPQDRDA